MLFTDIPSVVTVTGLKASCDRELDSVGSVFTCIHPISISTHFGLGLLHYSQILTGSLG